MNAMTHDMPAEFLKSLVGSWEGTCQTWFEPGTLADESRVTGGMKPRLGEETIALNSEEYPGATHTDAAGRAYAERDLIAWLLAQHR